MLQGLPEESQVIGQSRSTAKSSVRFLQLGQEQVSLGLSPQGFVGVREGLALCFDPGGTIPLEQLFRQGRKVLRMSGVWLQLEQPLRGGDRKRILEKRTFERFASLERLEKLEEKIAPLQIPGGLGGWIALDLGEPTDRLYRFLESRLFHLQRQQLAKQLLLSGRLQRGSMLEGARVPLAA